MQFDPPTLTSLAAVLVAAGGVIVSVSKEARNWFSEITARRPQQTTKSHKVNRPKAPSITPDVTPERNDETSIVPKDNTVPPLRNRQGEGEEAG